MASALWPPVSTPRSKATDTALPMDDPTQRSEAPPMGRRASAESAVAVIAAFYRRQRWRQADLARDVGISSEALAQVMRQLQDRGLPLTRDDSDRPQVWWRVPHTWAPGGVFFPADRTPALLRTLVRSPRSRERDTVIEHNASTRPPRA